MPTWTCEECQVELAAEDFDDHVTLVHAHFTEAHPQYRLTERQVSNYLERMGMLSPDTERVDEIGVVEIVPLTPDRVDDVMMFFDRDAFAGNPAWASCYCMAHHVPGGELGEAWGDRSWRDNRAELVRMVKSGAITGVLAYEDGRLVGWCNASPRDRYPDYAKADDTDTTTGVVACFAVAPTHRGHGLARRMLDFALERFGEAGLNAVEAHPATDPKWDGAAYRGTVPLYRDHGFDVVSEDERITVVRRDL